MRIEDRFTVSLPIDETWKVFLDVERIAPCMPGAQLQEMTDDEYRGVVKVKLGAITAQYKGVVRFEEVDEAAHRMVLRAEGRETRGQGNAAATVVATLSPASDGGTDVAIETDLTITGRIAQFGRGVMADVSSKLLGEFARCLEDDLAKEFSKAQASSDDAGPAPSATVPAPESNPTTDRTPAPAPARTVQSEAVEPLDLLAIAGGSMAQRAIPVAIVADFLLLALVKGKATRWVLAATGAGLAAGLLRRQE